MKIIAGRKHPKYYSRFATANPLCLLSGHGCKIGRNFSNVTFSSGCFRPSSIGNVFLPKCLVMQTPKFDQTKHHLPPPSLKTTKAAVRQGSDQKVRSDRGMVVGQAGRFYQNMIDPVWSNRASDQNMRSHQVSD